MTGNSAIEFLIWMLIVASAIAVLANRFHLPYTVALVIGGVFLGAFHKLPLAKIFAEGRQPDWLTPRIILTLLLPPLLFGGSIKIPFRRLRENLFSILLLANIGVLVATLITGYAIHWVFGLPVLVGLLFGSIISATDPVSVLAIFQELGVGRRLSIIVEGESLFNDGTAVVLFGLLLSGVVTGRLGIASGVGQFLIEVAGAAAFGSAMGYISSKVTQNIDEPRIEITLTMVLAYTSYLLADHIGLSGVIATVAAGLVIGNFGARVGMSERTRVALWSFWDYVEFLINSVLFLLIGMRVDISSLASGWRATLLAVAAVLLGRAIAIYGLTPITRLFGEQIPLRWQHVMVWGGLRGAVALAMALSLSPSIPHRDQLLAWTFGVVAFSIVVQGLTLRPLLRLLRLRLQQDSAYDRAKVLQIALASAKEQLDGLLDSHTVSKPLHAMFREALDADLVRVEKDVSTLYEKRQASAETEVRMAQSQLRAAQKSAIYRAQIDGLISQQTAEDLIDSTGSRLNDVATELLREQTDE